MVGWLGYLPRAMRCLRPTPVLAIVPHQDWNNAPLIDLLRHDHLRCCCHCTVFPVQLRCPDVRCMPAQPARRLYVLLALPPPGDADAQRCRHYYTTHVARAARAYFLPKRTHATCFPIVVGGYWWFHTRCPYALERLRLVALATSFPCCVTTWFGVLPLPTLLLYYHLPFFLLCLSPHASRGFILPAFHCMHVLDITPSCPCLLLLCIHFCMWLLLTVYLSLSWPSMVLHFLTFCLLYTH